MRSALIGFRDDKLPINKEEIQFILFPWGYKDQIGKKGGKEVM